jgi:hypothetical protein
VEAIEVVNWRARIASAIGAIILITSSVLPVHAGPAELALLKAYIGEWSGAGVLQGGKKPEPFRCRLTIDKGNQAKINYAGRCTLVNMNLSVSGTIAFDDASQRYQAVMSSNAGFKGLAIGQEQGDKIVFDLHEKQQDRSGNDVKIGSRITLIGNTSITVDFQVEFNNSGNVLTASVPFAK